MKKILLSLGVIAIVAVGAIGATRAYFTDTEIISGNTFTSGSMALKIDKDPAGSLYNWSDSFGGGTFTNMNPGAEGEQIIDIMNIGGIDGNATFDINRTSDWSNLADALVFHVYFKANHNDSAWIDTSLAGKADAFVGPYTLGQFAGAAEDLAGQTGQVASVKIEWSVPASAGNEIMGDSVTVNAVFGLTQVIAD